MRQKKTPIGGTSLLDSSDDRSESTRSLGADCYGETEEVLIEHNLWRVPVIVKRFRNTGVEYEDLVSMGTLGLVKAVQTFRPERHVQLQTYATRCILNEVLMYLKHRSCKKNSAIVVSLEETLNEDADGHYLTREDVLGTDEYDGLRCVETKVERQLLSEAIKKLKEQEKTVIGLRFGYGARDDRELSQKEVGEILGLSQSYVSRVEKRALKRLKTELLAVGF